MTRKWIDLNDRLQSQQNAVDALYGGERNAEWRLLVMWAAMQMEGEPLEPEFELAAIALLVGAIAHGKLPTKIGKPEQNIKRCTPQKIAAAFNEAMASELFQGREDVIAELAKKFEVTGRTVESRLQRAGDAWPSSPDKTLAFLKRVFPAKGMRAIKANSTLLSLTRKSAARK